MEIGMQRFGQVWCIFKIEGKEEYWLDKNKQWKTKWDKAGIRDEKKAQKLLNQLVKESLCTQKQLSLDI